MFDWFPRNISTYGGEIDAVFYLIFYIVGTGFLLGEGFVHLNLVVFTKTQTVAPGLQRK